MGNSVLILILQMGPLLRFWASKIAKLERSLRQSDTRHAIHLQDEADVMSSCLICNIFA